MTTKTKKDTEIKNEEYENLFKENIKSFRDKKEFIIPGSTFKNLQRQKIIIEDSGIFHIGENYKKPITCEKVLELIRIFTKVQLEDNQKAFQLNEKDKLEDYFEKLLGDL